MIQEGDKVRFSYTPKEYPKLLINGHGVVTQVHKEYCDIYTDNGLRSIPIQYVKLLRGKGALKIRTNLKARKPQTKKQVHTKSVKKRRRRKPKNEKV